MSLVDRLEQVLKCAQKRARRRSVPCDLTVGHVLWLYDQQRGRCALSGRALLLQAPSCNGGGMALQDGPSLDQIVPGGGYLAGNVQLVTTQCNLAKSTLSARDFVALCEQIHYFQRQL